MRSIGVACFSVVLLSAAASSAASAEPVDPSHALAQKFAADAPKPAAKAPAAQAAPVFKTAPKPGDEYEKEMLDAARAEAETRRMAETPPPAPKPATAPAAMPPAAAPAAAAPAPVQQAATKPDIVPAAKDTAPTSSGDTAPTHVTVLLVLTSRTAAAPQGKVQSNPIVCAGETCYLSAGNSSPSKAMPRAEAMAAKNAALGLTTACEGKTSCVFRDVTLPPSTSLQVVDAGFARAEPFAAVDVKPDKTCAITEGDLDCEEPVTAKDYRLWLVPEQLAQSAKAAQIEDALSTGLVEENVTRAEDK